MALPTPATDQNFWIPLNASALTSGLNLNYATASTITFTPGNVLDSKGQNYINIISSGVLNTALTGVLNGLDTGTVAASSLYYVYAVGCSLNHSANPTGLIASLSATSPVMPPQAYNTQAYDMARLVGFFFTDGSSNIIKFKQYGNGSNRTIYLDAMQVVLSAGTATSLTAIDLTGHVPPVEGIIAGLQVNYTPATAGDTVSIAPGVSTATLLPNVVGQVAAHANSGSIEQVVNLVTGAPHLQYINSAGSGSASAWLKYYKYNI